MNWRLRCCSALHIIEIIKVSIANAILEKPIFIGKNALPYIL